MKDGHRPTRLWSGICASAAQTQAETAPRLSTYEIEIVPTLWLLGKRSGHRIFQHLSIPDIIDKLLGEWRITPTWQIDRGRYPKLEFKVQYGESDFTLFSRLLEEAGIAYFFEDDDAETKLVLRDEPQTAARRGGDPIPYFEHADHSDPREYVNHAIIGHDVRPGAFVLMDYDFRRPALPLREQAPKSPSPEDRNEEARYEPGSYLAEGGAGGGTPVADDKGIARYDNGYGRDKATRLLGGARAGKGHRHGRHQRHRPAPRRHLRGGQPQPPRRLRPPAPRHPLHPGGIARRALAPLRSAPSPPRSPTARPPSPPGPVVHGIQSATVVGRFDADDEAGDLRRRVWPHPRPVPLGSRRQGRRLRLLLDARRRARRTGAGKAYPG